MGHIYSNALKAACEHTPAQFRATRCDLIPVVGTAPHDTDPLHASLLVRQVPIGSRHLTRGSRNGHITQDPSI